MTHPQLRAGDNDRSAVIDLLRAHHLDGRLTVEEFEERVDRAHRAVTLLELGDLHEDLPELQPRRGKVVRRSTRAPRIPGRLPFVDRIDVVAPVDVARREAFETIAPALARHGYRLAIDAQSLVFHRRRHPPWTVVVAILVFPFGLLALTHTESDEIVIEFRDGPGGGTSLLAYGTGSLHVRRAFAQLSD